MLKRILTRIMKVYLVIALLSGIYYYASIQFYSGPKPFQFTEYITPKQEGVRVYAAGSRESANLGLLQSGTTYYAYRDDTLQEFVRIYYNGVLGYVETQYITSSEYEFFEYPHISKKTIFVETLHDTPYYEDVERTKARGVVKGLKRFELEKYDDKNVYITIAGKRYIIDKKSIYPSKGTQISDLYTAYIPNGNFLTTVQPLSVFASSDLQEVLGTFSFELPVLYKDNGMYVVLFGGRLGYIPSTGVTVTGNLYQTPVDRLDITEFSEEAPDSEQRFTKERLDARLKKEKMLNEKELSDYFLRQASFKKGMTYIRVRNDASLLKKPFLEYVRKKNIGVYVDDTVRGKFYLMESELQKLDETYPLVFDKETE